MNCLPTSKILSNKSKNKYLLSATQKYEQRIRDAKQNQKPELHFQTTKSRQPDCRTERLECNPTLDQWITKRKEIDKWRKSVLNAFQIETQNSSISSNVTDSQGQLESSTLTTSNTLCSDSKTNTNKMRNKRKEIPVKMEQNLGKLPKSPSIPLYHSNYKTATETTNNAAFLYKFYVRPSNDSSMSIVDDDDVFVACDSPQCSRNPGYCSSSSSSNNVTFPVFNEIVQSNNFRNQANINKKYTPQPTKRPFFLPGHHYNQVPFNDNDRVQSQKFGYQNSRNDWKINNNGNMMSDRSPSNQMSLSVHSHDMVFPTPKKTLHKNETNIKIVLKPSNYLPNNDYEGCSQFQRTRSLNIKRSPQNIEPQSQTKVTSSNYDNVMDYLPNNGYSASCMKNYVENNGNGKINGQKYLDYGQSKFILRKPTFSQENICYSTDNNVILNGPLLKISSYNNLRSVTRDIPKVSIKEPLTMKFVFGSEPSLLRNF